MAEADDMIDDDVFDPDTKLRTSKHWLKQIADAEKALEDYQRKADDIDRIYADLERLASISRDRQFQLFWANVEVIKPSIYARPPVPVVVPRFNDRNPVTRLSSELLERTSMTALDIGDIDSVMIGLRDDLAVVARGAGWVRYETSDESDTDIERIVFEHLDRKDFAHEPARKWADVGWVARRGWLTRRQMRKRFFKTSGNAYQNANYAVLRDDKENGAADNREKCGVWEIWSKTDNRVFWVTEGVEVVLDEDKPHLKLEGFFPCPRPAYGTLQRRSLVPVPDMLYYKDQLEEINELTNRIHALSQAIKVRAFYPLGAGAEIGEAIQKAVLSNDDRQVMVPISNWAAFGASGAKDTIVWLPIDMIVQTIKELVGLRQEIIDNVYQIMGLSDIMRGSTRASETATAQQIKAQYGSVRIRDKIEELVRIARDMVRIAAEIMAENFSRKTLLDMSRMEIPTDADIKRQIEALGQQAQQQLNQQVQQALADPELAQQAKENPQAAQQLAQQAQQQIMAQMQPQIEKLEKTPTIERVMEFLRDQRIRPFELKVETDSTIQPDEQAEKESRTEFMNVFSMVLERVHALVMGEPAAAPMAGEMIKFALRPYRAGREIEGAIDDFIERMIARASQPPQPDPQSQAAQAAAQLANDRLAFEREKFQGEMTFKMQDLERKTAEAAQKAQISQAELASKIDAQSASTQKTLSEIEKILAQVDQIMVQTRQTEVETGLSVERQDLEAARTAHGMAAQDRSAALNERQAKAITGSIGQGVRP